MATPSGSAASQSPTIAVVALGTAVAALAIALYAAFASRPAPAAPPVPSRRRPSFPRHGDLHGAVAESPDDPFWKIPLDKCDKAIDAIDVKAGFVSKWSICGGAKSFEVTLDPRAVIVSSDAVHCSNTPSEVSVTFIGQNSSGTLRRTAAPNCRARSGVRRSVDRPRRRKLEQKPGAVPMSMSMIETGRVNLSGPASPGEDVWWDAMRRRDPAYDGAFFVAVRTTGVYCRPSCKSRPPRRENVSFFPTAEAAERAGYRACKRCRPDRLGAPDPQVEAVRRACETIASAEEAPSLADLAASAGLSPFHFHRVFKKVAGVTPKAYAAQMRAGRAAENLAQGPDGHRGDL